MHVRVGAIPRATSGSVRMSPRVRNGVLYSILSSHQRTVQSVLFTFCVVIVTYLFIYVGGRWDALMYHRYYGHWPDVKRSDMAPVSLGNSINHSRCDQNYKVYIYDSSRIFPQEERDPSRYRDCSVPIRMEKNAELKCFSYREVLKAIRTSNFSTSNPDEACLFVVDFDTLCLENRCEPHEYLQLKLLRYLPYWNEGRNHVIFEMSDSPCAKYETDRAMRVRSAFSSQCFRRGLDVQIPLFNYWYFDHSDRHQPLSKRPYLAIFKGSATDVNGVRMALRTLHNREDFLVYLRCDEEHEISNCDDFDERNYLDMLKSAVFGLCPLGWGFHSYRLLETLSAGAIPVIIGDAYELPLSDVLDWTSFSVVIPEELSSQTRTILEAIPRERIMQMQRSAIFVYEEYFSSAEKLVRTSLISSLCHANAYMEQLRGNRPSLCASLPLS